MPEIAGQVSSSIDALTQEFRIIANNLANVSTAGYKRRCNSFSLNLEAQKRGLEPQPIGSIDLQSTLDFSQGPIVETGRPLDFALSGKGFFVIETPEGPLYTRNGIFQINSNGQIVNSDGKLVAGEAGPISIPSDISPSQLAVSNDGTISAAGTIIGKLRLVDFADNQDKLVPVGWSCFQMPEDIEAAAAQNVAVKQGYQESSNVEMVDELVGLILVSRLYEANMKFISASSEASQSIMNVAMG